MARLEFTAQEATAHKAIVVSLDLAGFSDFCNQPEASITVPRLAKHFFDLLNKSFVDQNQYSFFVPNKLELGKLVVPDFIKFTGDGALMLWVIGINEDFPQTFCNLVVQSMRDFQGQLATELPEREKQWGVQRLPKQVRVGIASGIVYALRPPHSPILGTSPSDYVGYCINLAVRLQNHCSELGFLVHGNLHSNLPGMEVFIAANMKGSQPETVALFREDANRVVQADLERKFRARART